MKDQQKTVGEILDKHLPRTSEEQVNAVGDRVLYRLHHARPVSETQTIAEEGFKPRSAGNNFWHAVVATVAILVVSAAMFGVFARKSVPAPESHSKGAIEHQPTQTLSDGSQVEARAASKWSVEAAADGLKIRLTHGSIIVNAAKQSGHLYVETPHLAVSVVGTVFIVSAEAHTAEVGVIEGQVRVRGGNSEVSLGQGEQISSVSFTKERLMPDAFTWSRNAERYFALLMQTPIVPLASRRQKASFEVASIKRNDSGDVNGGIRPRGDRFAATNVTLIGVLMYAYMRDGEPFSRKQILGTPAWAETDRYDVEAKMGTDVGSLPREQVREMVRSMLEERFQLKAHRETRELPVYNLVTVKGGPKLSTDQTAPPSQQRFITFVTEGEELKPLPRGAVRIMESPLRTVLSGTAVSMSTVVSLLQQPDRIVLDKTNFTGLFDFEVQFAKDSGAIPPPDTPIPSLFSAIQELNLRLESGVSPFPVVVVDSVQRPSPN